MRAKVWIIAVAAWLIGSAVTGSARVCEAGFLPSEAAVQSLLELDGGSSSFTSDPAPQPPQDDEAYLLRLLSPANPAAENPGPQSSSSSSTQRLLDLGTALSELDASRTDGVLAVERLQLEKSRLIPAVHLSRVFRPPRA